MDDWDGPDLGPLTAGVDHPASRDLFDKRRRRHRRHRRVGAGALVALVVLGGAVAVEAATGGDGGTRVATAPPEGSPTAVAPASPEDVAFTVVAQRPAKGDDVGQLRSATDAVALDMLWAAIGFEGPPPSIDLSRDVVVSITIADDACPPELVELARDGDQVTPVFEQPAGGCDQPLIPKTYVVAIDRSSVETVFVVHLPFDLELGTNDQRLTVVVDQGASELFSSGLRAEPAGGLASGDEVAVSVEDPDEAGEVAWIGQCVSEVVDQAYIEEAPDAEVRRSCRAIQDDPGGSTTLVVERRMSTATGTAVSCDASPGRCVIVARRGPAATSGGLPWGSAPSNLLRP